MVKYFFIILLTVTKNFIMKYINFFKWTLLLTAFTVFMACSNETETTEEEMVVEEEQTATEPVMNANTETTAADTSSTGVYQEEVTESPGSLKEAMQSSNNQPVVEEGGLSFCDCVKKQKELNELIMETEDDAEMEKAMTELETMKTGECKVLFSAKQNTIEEKEAHARRVKKCL
ncbi:MAG: hypothetical protein VR77_05460 [Flavobacteriales bacterium BRH_c54]|nr:MAG: hypothetical protein VR77_05460 [Flavobacteriales bacterium BRH_c54]